MEKVDLKERLTGFVGLTYEELHAIPEAEIRAVVDEMLANFGAADHEVRDELIYPIFTQLINENILNDEDYVRILDICLDEEHLFYNIGEISDAVFVRSLSSLVISTILEVNIRQNFLIPIVLDVILDKALKYIIQENDSRGYIEEKGWAHAIANGVDMLQSLVLNPQVPTDRYADILIAVENCLFKDVAYLDQESERFSGVVRAMLDRGLITTALFGWIDKITSRLISIYNAHGFTYKFHRRNVNVSNFLKTLYFDLKKEGERINLRVHIFNNVKRLQEL